MKYSIDHLPKIKQDELQNIVLAIRQNCDDVEKVILFGSYARGNYKEFKDLKPDRKSGHISDYDILVITKTKEVALDSMLWKRISEICRSAKNLTADPRIITHDIEALNIKLAEGQYFYSDIKKEGISIYDANNFKLSNKRDLSPKEEQRIAKDHYEHWFSKAQFFFDDYNANLEKSSQNWKYLSQAAFYLHQAAESAYKTLHLVFTNYCPNEHLLKALGFEAQDFHLDLKTIFVHNNKEDENRFKLLEVAYIGGRYDPEYRISKEDLEILAREVERLLVITEKICSKRIEGFIS